MPWVLDPYLLIRMPLDTLGMISEGEWPYTTDQNSLLNPNPADKMGCNLTRIHPKTGPVHEISMQSVCRLEEAIRGTEIHFAFYIL